MAASRIALWFAASSTLCIVGVYRWGLFIAAAGFPFGAEILLSLSPDPLSCSGDGRPWSDHTVRATAIPNAAQIGRKFL
jgi:hypothetical protein